jgi:hypothetical protein
MGDFKLSPRCSLVIRSGGLSLSLVWLVTDIEGQRIGPYPTFRTRSPRKLFYDDKWRSQPAHATAQISEVFKLVMLQQEAELLHIPHCKSYGVDSRRIKCVYGEWMVLYWQRKPDVSEEISPTVTSSTLAQGPNPNGTYDIKCYLLLISEAALERNSCRRALLSADTLDSGVAGFEDRKSFSSLLCQCFLGRLRSFRLLCRFEYTDLLSKFSSSSYSLRCVGLLSKLSEQAKQLRVLIFHWKFLH